MRKICIVVASRANYSSIKSVMRAIQDHPALELQLVTAAAALLDRYGSVEHLIESDGFTPQARVHMLVEGETPVTMAKSTGLGLIELPTVFDRLQPDVVLTVGDRFETMATALAASYMNIALAHTMGGEVSGNIDENIRHAVTKFAHIHFPACEDAQERIVRLGEDPKTVHLAGCPRMDLVAEYLADGEAPRPELFREGVGHDFDWDEPFLMISQHPVTTEYGDGERQVAETLGAAERTGMPTVVFWPNPDAGSDDVARGVRKFRERHPDLPIHFFKNIPVRDYVHLMSRTACLIGNSSSGIREGAFIGTPVVNVGSRQEGRQRGKNVIDVGYDAGAIHAAILRQVENGRYASDPIYGDGRAGKRIADVLATAEISLLKRITY